jgi:hypothetical protein
MLIANYMDIACMHLCKRLASPGHCASTHLSTCSRSQGCSSYSALCSRRRAEITRGNLAPHRDGPFSFAASCCWGGEHPLDIAEPGICPLGRHIHQRHAAQQSTRQSKPCDGSNTQQLYGKPPGMCVEARFPSAISLAPSVDASFRMAPGVVAFKGRARARGWGTSKELLCKAWTCIAGFSLGVGGLLLQCLRTRCRHKLGWQNGEGRQLHATGAMDKATHCCMSLQYTRQA